MPEKAARIPTSVRPLFRSIREGLSGVHILISLLAASRVRALALLGKDVRPNQMGLEISTIRRRLGTVVVRANNTLLLGKMGASRGRQHHGRKEEGGS